jgi:predicted nucleotidyltransferase
MNHHLNISRIKSVFHALGELKEKVVFVGGATVSLYIDGKSEEIRPTDDIDVVIEMYSHQEYAALDEKLRRLGFENDQTSGIICRYKINGLVVDIVPTQSQALGFTNKWYQPAFEHAIHHSIGNDKIKIFTPPYFLASKLEAFLQRGKNDGRTSTDFEDIIFLLENRSTIWQELEAGEIYLSTNIKETFKKLMENENFEEWVDSHAGFGRVPATQFIMRKLEMLTNNNLK